MSVCLDTAHKTGLDERTVCRDASRGERIAPDVLRVVAGTSLDTGSPVDKIARLPVEQQRRAVVRLSPLDILAQPNSHVMKGHLKNWAALLIEIATVFATTDILEACFQ